MNRLRLLLNISELLSKFSIQVSILNAGSMFDINTISEDFLIPIFNEIYNCNFINANIIHKNYAAVDLIDKSKKVAIQITSTSTSQKVKDTLHKIVDNGLFNTYDEFYIMFITGKKVSITQTTIDSIVTNNFIFTNKNLLDIEELFAIIKTLETTKLKLLLNHLQSEYTNSDNITRLIELNKASSIGNGSSILINSLESIHKIMIEWVQKKDFLELQLPSIYDFNQKYSTLKSIEECNENISQCERKIFDITSKKSNT
ncbi:MAG: SMEK domain-containing protein [Flavobacterium sp.]